MPLEEIARTTRVAQRYLEALEADAFDRLPPAVFTRGFIRAYCQALAEPPEQALACYDARDGGVPPPATRPASPARAGQTEPRTRGAILVSFVLLVVLGMALFTVAFVIQPRDRGEQIAADARPVTPPTAGPSAPAPVGALTQAPAPAPTTPPAPMTARPVTPPSPPAPPAAIPVPPVVAPPPVASAPAPVPNVDAVASPYRLIARTSETTWIRVRTEDGRITEETVPAGEVREWVSDRPFSLTIGNAGGVNFELNGRAVPPLGARGAVIPRLVLPAEVGAPR